MGTPTPTDRQRQAASFLRCRTLLHAWDDIPADAPPKWGGEQMWLRCQRCDTERHDEVHRGTGELLARRYVYPDGYRHAFDTQFTDAAPTRADFRRMMLESHLNRARGTTRPFGKGRAA